MQTSLNETHTPNAAVNQITTMTSTAQRFTRTTFALILSAIVSAAAEEPKPVAPTWFDARPERTFVIELVLKPGETKPVTIKTKKPTVVGFQTNFTTEQAKQFEQKPIMLSTEDVSAGSSVGAWMMFEPRGGTIALKVENKTTIEVRVAIYTKEKM